MKIAIEGCAHGELEKIYNSIELLERKENVKIDLLICCGDFQSTRNLSDLRCMAVPPKYYNICTFYKYYSGEKIAPYLTIFIGGNHEASNYLQELPYGGWVAPNIYYLGYASVVNVAGIRIAGISGIHKPFDYRKGHFESAPYTRETMRSVYHIRNLEVFRLKQIARPIDIFLSHDWPRGVYEHGNVNELLRIKPFFRGEIGAGKLGSEPNRELLYHLKPNYWFAAHLHCKFAALISHKDEVNSEEKITKFLALDKCLPRRKFLQIIDVPHDPDMTVEIKYDLEWLTILFLTNHLLNVKYCDQYLPGPGSELRWNFTPSREEKDLILEKFDYDLTVPLNFVQTAPPYKQNDEQNTNIQQPDGKINEQTSFFCKKLSIDDPNELVLSLTSNTSIFIPSSVEVKHHTRLNLSLPEPKCESSPKLLNKLSLTLPPPKNDPDEINFTDSNTTIEISSQESNLSECSFNSSNTFESVLTPQPKKFKRRNESIYKNDD